MLPPSLLVGLPADGPLGVAGAGGVRRCSTVFLSLAALVPANLKLSGVLARSPGEGPGEVRDVMAERSAPPLGRRRNEPGHYRRRAACVRLVPALRAP